MLYSIAAFLELFAEPFYIRAQRRSQFRLRLATEAVATLSRSFITFYFVADDQHGCKCATCVRVWSTRVCIVPCVILHVGPHAIAGSRRKTFTRGRKNRMEHTDSCRFILATGKKTTAFESFREGRHDGNESDFVIETIKS